MSKETKDIDPATKRRRNTRFVLALFALLIITAVAVFLLNNDVNELFPKKPIDLPNAPA